MERDQHPATILTEQAYYMSPKNFSINEPEDFFSPGKSRQDSTYIGPS